LIVELMTVIVAVLLIDVPLSRFRIFRHLQPRPVRQVGARPSRLSGHADKRQVVAGE
jgi:hypothetical protein